VKLIIHLRLVPNLRIRGALSPCFLYTYVVLRYKLGLHLSDITTFGRKVMNDELKELKRKRSWPVEFSTPDFLKTTRNLCPS
jgi:hypothetical protein